MVLTTDIGEQHISNIKKYGATIEMHNINSYRSSASFLNAIEPTSQQKHKVANRAKRHVHIIDPD